MNDGEVAFRIVRLYFEEIARLGFKRQLDLDQIINAYFYTLKKLGNKEELIRKATIEIKNAEKQMVVQKNSETTEQKTIEKKFNVIEPKEKSITEILEND